MASIWNFIKRHKGKIAVGGAIGGGLYALHRYLEEHPELVEQLARKLNVIPPEEGSFNPSGHSSSSHQRNRQEELSKYYLFEAHQKTCDKTILDLLPALKSKIQERFNLEDLTARLRHGDFKDEEEKVKLWERMKVESVCRLLASAYGYSILIVALKSQITILASELYENSKQKQNKPLKSSSTSMFSFVTQWAYGDTGDSNTSGGSTSGSSTLADPSSHELFLQCVQYFTNFGLKKLMDKIEEIVCSITENVSLKEIMTPDRLRGLLRKSKSQLDSSDFRNFSHFVIPITANEDVFAAQSESLTKLLLTLKVVFESPDCRQQIMDSTDKFVRKCVAFSRNHSPDGYEEDGVPMARLIPVLSDSFHTMSSTESDSLIQDILDSEEIKEYCKSIFDKDEN